MMGLDTRLLEISAIGRIDLNGRRYVTIVR